MQQQDLANDMAEQIYRVARYSTFEVPYALHLMFALWGMNCIRTVPGGSVWKKGVLSSDGLHPRLHVRADLTTPEKNHAAARAVATWWLRKQRLEHEHRLLCALMAALCVPEEALLAKLDELGEDRAALSRAFVVSESLMALRIGEVLNRPTVLITPRFLGARGSKVDWPNSRDGWATLLSNPRWLYCVERLGDARGRRVVTFSCSRKLFAAE